MKITHTNIIVGYKKLDDNDKLRESLREAMNKAYPNYVFLDEVYNAIISVEELKEEHTDYVVEPTDNNLVKAVKLFRSSPENRKIYVSIEMLSNASKDILDSVVGSFNNISILEFTK